MCNVQVIFGKNKCEFYTHFQNKDRKKVEFGSSKFADFQFSVPGDIVNIVITLKLFIVFIATAATAATAAIIIVVTITI